MQEKGGRRKKRKKSFSRFLLLFFGGKDASSVADGRATTSKTLDGKEGRGQVAAVPEKKRAEKNMGSRLTPSSRRTGSGRLFKH